MARGTDGDPGAKHDVVPNMDGAVIHKCQIEVCVDVVAEVHMGSTPVRVEGWLDVAAGTDGSEHLVEELRSALAFRWTGGIEIIKLLKCFVLACAERYRAGIVNEARSHALFIVHDVIFPPLHRFSQLV